MWFPDQQGGGWDFLETVYLNFEAVRLPFSFFEAL